MIAYISNHGSDMLGVRFADKPSRATAMSIPKCGWIGWQSWISLPMCPLTRCSVTRSIQGAGCDAYRHSRAEG